MTQKVKRHNRASEGNKGERCCICAVPFPKGKKYHTLQVDLGFYSFCDKCILTTTNLPPIPKAGGK